MHTIIRLFLSAWILSSNWIVSFGILFHSGENNFSEKKISLRDGKERKRERKVLFPIIIEMLTPLSWKIQIANLFPEIRQFPLNDLFSPSPRPGGNPFLACISRQRQLAGTFGKDNTSRPVRNGIHWPWQKGLLADGEDRINGGRRDTRKRYARPIRIGIYFARNFAHWPERYGGG